MNLFFGFLAYVAGLAALFVAGFVGLQAALFVPDGAHAAKAVEKPVHSAGLPPIIKPIAKPEVAKTSAPKKAQAPAYAKWAKQKAHEELSSSHKRRHAQRKPRAPMTDEARNAYASGATSSYQAPDIHSSW